MRLHAILAGGLFVVVSLLTDQPVWAQLASAPHRPGVATPIVTTGPVLGPSLTLVWTAVPGADVYLVRLRDEAGTTFEQEVTPAQATCLLGGVCRAVILAADFVPGEGSWWVQASNTAGAGPWSAAQGFAFALMGADGLMQLGNETGEAGAAGQVAGRATAGSRPSSRVVLKNEQGTLLMGTNTGYGDAALGAVTSGVHNSGFGYYALAKTMTGNRNTGVGFAAMSNNVSGGANTAVGWGTLNSASDASSNTAVGYAALNSTVSGFGNVGLGVQALLANTTGFYNTGVGMNALYRNLTGYGNVGVGYGALLSNQSGQYNTAVGYGALSDSVDTHSSTAVGYYALAYNTTGAYNTGLGYLALGANTTGRRATSVGFRALASQTTSSDNTAVGYMALTNAATGNANTAVGASALTSSTTGAWNTALGSGALASITTGYMNTAVGTSALDSCTTPTRNVAIGFNSLNSLTVGEANTFVGAESGAPLTTGSSNVGVGFTAGANLTSGSRNVFLGWHAGERVTTGDDNIHIANRGTAADITTIRLGTLGVHTATFIGGIRTVTTGNPDAVAVLIDSAGQLGTVSSSRRYKEDIRDMGDASSGVLRLRPVTFRYTKPYADGTTPLDYGLIAEEVADVLPGLVVRNDQGEPETVKYHLLPVMLLNELQKQQARINVLESRLAQMEALLLSMKQGTAK